jgi:methyltransferase family protein
MAAKAVKVTRQDVLVDLVRQRGWTMGAELGVWQAQNLAVLLERCPGLYMVGVDHWRQEGAYADKDMVLAERTARDALVPFGERCRLYRQPTVEAAARFEDGGFDFVFIDAAHDEASVRADILAWAPKVRAGGAVLGHDINLEGVRNAVEQLCPGWYPCNANVWLWPKPAS